MAQLMCSSGWRRLQHDDASLIRVHDRFSITNGTRYVVDNLYLKMEPELAFVNIEFVFYYNINRTEEYSLVTKSRAWSIDYKETIFRSENCNDMRKKKKNENKPDEVTNRPVYVQRKSNELQWEFHKRVHKECFRINLKY